MTLWSRLTVLAGVIALGTVAGSFLKSTEKPDCTCDCCLSQLATADDASSDYVSGLKCAVTQLSSGVPVTESCLEDVCLSSPKNSDQLDVATQYAHFCYSSCAPARNARQANIACVDSNDPVNADLTKGAVAKQQSVTSTSGTTAAGATDTTPAISGSVQNLFYDRETSNSGNNQRAKAPRLGASEPTTAPGVRNVNLFRSRAPAFQEPTVGAVKAQMMQAYSYAKAAGLAAMHAKVAYERIMGNVRILSEKAGKVAMEEIKREAREQATTAKLRHSQFVKAAQDGAIGAADAEAAVYQAKAAEYGAAKDKLQASSDLYRLAATQRTTLADQWATRLALAKLAKDTDAVKQDELQLKQAQDQAAQFAATADSVQGQANDAGAGQAFFKNNELGAHQWMLESKLPPGIPLPPPVVTENPYLFKGA